MLVLARYVHPTQPRSKANSLQVNVPVKLQDPALDVTINPGDIIFGDLNGVVCVPKDAVDKILELMPKLVEADEKMAKDIAKGMTFAEAKDKYRS